MTNKYGLALDSGEFVPADELNVHAAELESQVIADCMAGGTGGVSPPEGMAGWMPIAEAPKTGRTLLLGYFNSAGKWRTTRGQWMSQDYIDEYAEEPERMESGWHETTVEDDDGKCWPIDPTHYMPLPAPPLASEAKEL